MRPETQAQDASAPMAYAPVLDWDFSNVPPQILLPSGELHQEPSDALDKIAGLGQQKPATTVQLLNPLTATQSPLASDTWPRYTTDIVNIILWNLEVVTAPARFATPRVVTSFDAKTRYYRARVVNLRPHAGDTQIICEGPEAMTSKESLVKLLLHVEQDVGKVLQGRRVMQVPPSQDQAIGIDDVQTCEIFPPESTRAVRSDRSQTIVGQDETDQLLGISGFSMQESSVDAVPVAMRLPLHRQRTDAVQSPTGLGQAPEEEQKQSQPPQSCAEPLAPITSSIPVLRRSSLEGDKRGISLLSVSGEDKVLPRLRAQQVNPLGAIGSGRISQISSPRIAAADSAYGGTSGSFKAAEIGQVRLVPQFGEIHPPTAAGGDSLAGSRIAMPKAGLKVLRRGPETILRNSQNN